MILFNRVKRYDADHLNRMAFGLFLQALLPFSFIPQGIFEGEKYQTAFTIFAIIGADLFMLGLLLHVWNLKIHQKVDVPFRYLGLVLTVGFVMSSIITGTKVMWTGSEWVIERTIQARLLLFIGVAWIVIESLRLFVAGFKVSNDIWGKISIAYVIGLVTSFILLAFREELPFSNVTYQIPTAIGAIIFSISLMKSPDAMIIPNVKISGIILAHRYSGLAVLNFPENLKKSVITASALSGIVQIIREIAGKEDLPSKLGYADYNIGIYPGKDIFIYAISNGTHPLLDGLLNQLANLWDHRFAEFKGLVTNEQITSFNNDVKNNIRIFLESDFA